MKFRTLVSLLLLVAFASQAQDTLPIYRKLGEIAVIDQKVMIPMRDGVRLATDIYRPKGNGKHPLILSRTPYNFNSWVDGKMTSRSFEEAYEAVSRGYAFAVQNERGRFFSEGHPPLCHVSRLHHTSRAECASNVVVEISALE